MMGRVRRIFPVLLLAILPFVGACGSDDDDSSSLFPPPSGPDENVGENAPPVASAGPDRAVAPGLEVLLDAGGSTDPEGDPLSFRWTVFFRPEGSTADLTGQTGATAVFRPDLTGIYGIRLEVSDGRSIDEDTLEIRVEPVQTGLAADAGPDRTVSVGGTVFLNGSGSGGPGGGLLDFSWILLRRPVGSNATIFPSDTPTVTFTADEAGLYLVQLTVSDEDGAFASDTVRITAGNVSGQELYDFLCDACHSLGVYDRIQVNDAPDLSARADRIPEVFARPHAGITLTSDEIAALQAFVSFQ